MSKTPSYRHIWIISYPIILSLLAQNIIGVVDTAFLGRVGEVELGASAIGGLFYHAIFMLGFGFGTGIASCEDEPEDDILSADIIFTRTSRRH